jgi:hypothetical protein
MIRRRIGDEFWLITQNDHALLSGQLAQHFGNDRFAPPEPRESVIVGISMHDAGWPLHDEKPTLNKRGEPLDVFETPPQIASMVWSEASRRAAERDPYAGLLVSLHGLSLSMFAMSPTRTVSNEKWNPDDLRTRFECNQFQHAQIELQEKLRTQLGLRTDLPTKGGLISTPTDDAGELSLRYNFRLLQAMDKLSLCLCCTTPPFERIEPLETRPDGLMQPLLVARPEPTRLTVNPWPFDVPAIQTHISFRRFPATRFANDEALQSAYELATPEQMTVALTPAT